MHFRFASHSVTPTLALGQCKQGCRASLVRCFDTRCSAVCTDRTPTILSRVPVLCPLPLAFYFLVHQSQWAIHSPSSPGLSWTLSWHLIIRPRRRRRRNYCLLIGGMLRAPLELPSWLRGHRINLAAGRFSGPGPLSPLSQADPGRRSINSSTGGLQSPRWAHVSVLGKFHGKTLSMF